MPAPNIPNPVPIPARIANPGLLRSAICPAKPTPNGKATPKPISAPMSAPFHREPFCSTDRRRTSSAPSVLVPFFEAISIPAGDHARNWPVTYLPSCSIAVTRASGCRDSKALQSGSAAEAVSSAIIQILRLM